MWRVGRNVLADAMHARATPIDEFSLLAKNSASATSYVRLPPEQVVELGTQIDL